MVTSSAQPPTSSSPSAILTLPSNKIALYSPEFYTACTIGGILSCGLTHTLVTPLDLVKCRRQVDPKLYSSIFDGWRSILRTEGGARGLFTGWLPTAIGYSAQGACKFGFYEYFKKTFADIAGPDVAHNYRTVLYLSASASAEVIADVALCPMEAVKVRMQTAPAATPFAANTFAAVSKMWSTEGLGGFFRGLSPLWMRQVPYTMMKFAAFEKTVEAIYAHVLSRPKHTYNKLEQLGVTFAAGYWAGIFCAVVSHPADTVVSKLNNLNKAAQGEGGTGAAIGKILKDLGFAGVWRGLGARIVMIGTLTALQWFIYDTFKVYAGLPTSGSVEKEKKQ